MTDWRNEWREKAEHTVFQRGDMCEGVEDSDFRSSDRTGSPMQMIPTESHLINKDKGHTLELK